ncbi:MAG TPA: calcium-binding protein [Opitutae bacterium]|nr:calcium-binding protein [Opitutae bacterium]
MVNVRIAHRQRISQLAETFRIHTRFEDQADKQSAAHLKSKIKKTMKTTSTLLALAAFALIPTLTQAQPEGQRGEGGKRPNPVQVMEKLDTDGSGTLSKDEAKGPLEKHFDKIDSDSNGELSKGEIAKAGKKMQGKKKDGMRFEKADADGSGTISKDEAGERLQGKFDDIDADGNGELTKEELRAAAEKRRGERGENKTARTI